MAKGKGKEDAMEGLLPANSDCSDANSGSAIKRKADDTAIDTAISSSSAKKRLDKMPMPEAPPARVSFDLCYWFHLFYF